MLTHFLGVCNIKKVCIDFMNGYHEDLAFYPLGIPRKGLMLHNDLATQMIGMHWR